MRDFKEYDVVKFNDKLYFFDEYIVDTEKMCCLINIDDTENNSWYYLNTLEYIMSYDKYRLDKALSKFSLTNDGKTYEITDEAIVFDIDYITKENKFYMVYGCFAKTEKSVVPNSNVWHEYMKEISLDTVEHLIKDMEAQDD